MTAPDLERQMSETPVTQTVAPTPRKALNPMLKFALELGPLALFFIAYGRLGIFAAISNRPRSCVIAKQQQQRRWR